MNTSQRLAADALLELELERLTLNLRWLDTDLPRWWEASPARRLICDRIVAIMRERVALLEDNA